MADLLEPRVLLAGNLTISEFMAANSGVLADADGEYSDWVEIHNSGSSPVDLGGYYLTDNATDLSKWAFPSVTLAPDGYLVVFASGKSRAVSGQQLHTNFNLNTDGEYLALVAPDGRTVVSQYGPAYPKQEPNVSFGVDPNSTSQALRYFAKPSPGARNARAEVVINEIHYAPDVKTELVEFIELHNPGSAPVDLSGARFTEGIDYAFPNGTVLAPGGYLVITENPAHYQQKFKKTALGPWVGSLSNEGETLKLRNSAGGVLDEVDYKLGFPWPTVGDSPGYSIELINPDFDNSIGGNWRSAGPSGPSQDITLFPAGSAWHYRKGDSEASSPIGAWRNLSFTEDNSWHVGTGPIGYDNNTAFPGSPELSDMRSRYTSVFMRKTFTVSDPSLFSTLKLEAMYDDGFNVWINGQRVAFSNVAGENLNYYALSSGGARETNNYDTVLVASVDGLLQPGENIIAVQFFNVNQGGSSDAFFDARLTASMGGGGTSPTPGKKNSVYAANAAPQMRQVSHDPQPMSDQPMTITVKVTDPEGVANVLLAYQLVDPGNYFSLEDAAYNNPANWIKVAMNDSGTGGDAVANDGVYTVVLPPSVQVHRRLVRYRITATDNLGASITAPYADDPQPNFAYYVYDGIPNWQGAIQPGSVDATRKQVVSYDFSAMPYMPVYQLITKRQSHVDSQSIPGSTQGQYWGDAYLWSGTLIYDGVVYDHIHYRARGGVWRYSMGKNMWKFDFNRGHEFQPKDEYGRLLATTWKKLNLGANIQQGNFGQRGEQGLFEYLGFKLFNLAGTPAPRSFPIHFRIVENASETNNTASQYDDDFQGMYLVIEQQDGRFLDEHDLPDGNLYKMETGPGGGESNNQGPTQPSDNSDLINFTNTYNNSTTTDQWWRDNLNLESYYNYRAIVEAIHHWDIGFGKNYYYYHNPETNKWEVLPWDLDLTWTTTYEPGGGDNEPFKSRVLSRPTLNIEYENRLREIRDLLFNSDQVGQMIDEYVAMVDSPSPGASMVDADRAMWDYNPIMTSAYVNPEKAGAGRFYQAASTKDFRGMAQRLKSYVVSRGTYLDSIAADSLIPNKPSITYTGAPGYALDGLTFRSSAFSDSSGTFAAMKWRIAEISDPSAPAYDPNGPRKYEIDAAWESPEITTFNNTITIPPTVMEDGRPRVVVEPGKTYRVRVRMKDSTGRWSKWSDAIQFTATPGSATVQNSLRISELHYDPASPPAGSTFTKDDFEFVELTNIGAQSINLKGVSFASGITFTFGDVELAPGQQVVVVKNLDAFKSRYRTQGMNIAGVYTGSLKDSGEQIKLVDSAGQTILDFLYSSDWHSTTNGDGDSMVIVDLDADPGTWNQSNAWRASRISGGTPGVEEIPLAKDSIVVNEIMSHTDAELGDWVEFHNTTDSAIDISGWWLSDDPDNPYKYRIQPGTIIPARGFIVFTQFAQFDKPGAPGVVTPFAFSELGGDEVVLSSADAAGLLTGYRAKQKVEATDKEITYGRYLTSTGVDFTALSSPTRGAANAGPMVGPVVISELMYFPTLGNDEFIELRNITGSSVPLFDPLLPNNRWKFSAGLTYEFPASTTLAANEYVLVVPIDPATFRSKYSIPQSVRIFGPYTGSLDNSGEAIALSRPGVPEPGGIVPYYVVDRVRYDTVAPWATEAYGTGPALGRRIGGNYGNDPANWAATIPGGTPGRTNFDDTPPTADIVDVTPDPRSSGVDSITITFSEPVTGFDLTDLVLWRNGDPVPFTSAQTLTSSDGVTWTLNNLSGLTFLASNYQLTLLAAGSGITDRAGNPIVENALDTFTVNTTTITGTPGNETYYLRRSGDSIQIFVNVPPSGSPTYVIPAALAGQLVIDAGMGADSLTVDQTSGSAIPGIGLSFNGGPGSDLLTFVINSGQNTLNLTDSSMSLNGATVSLANTEAVGLALSGSAKVSVPAGLNKALKLGGLSLADQATLELNDHDLIVSATPETRNAVLTAISNAIKNARETGTWAGSGLTSSAAKANKQTGLAVMLNHKNGQPILTTFGGQSVGVNDILVKYTWNGDVNLDGQVDAADYFLIDSGYITQQGGYRNGDLNFDGTVDAADYFLVDSAFIAQAGTLASATLARSAPQVPLAADATIFNRSSTIKPVQTSTRRQAEDRVWEQPKRSKSGRSLQRRFDSMF